MWRNLPFILILVHAVVATYNDMLSPETRMKCPSTGEQTYRLNPPKFHGIWTSSRCEIRPGPEFVLRKYIFRHKWFRLYQFYYFDTQCRRPKYSVVAEGSIKRQQMSWVVQGGTEAEYRLDNVTVTPYNRHFARKLNKKIQMHCKTLHGITVKRYRQYKIFNFPRSKNRNYKKSKDFDCSQLLSLSFHELQLLKVEVQKPPDHSYLYSNSINRNERPTRQLFFGDIHTDINQRMTYRPSSYQAPLMKGNTRSCAVCRKVKRTSEFRPPRLQQIDQQTRVIIDGHWRSTSCETRSYGQFLKRTLVFHGNGVSWEGHYDFYKDPDCQHGSLSVFVSGDYVKEKESRIIAGASDYKFNVTQMSITPRDYFIADTLNHTRSHTCGVQGLWKVNSKQSVLNTNGCIILGLHVPTTEYEIIMLDIRQQEDVMLVGERPTDGKSLTGPNIRPTSFQPPLVRCIIERTNNELPTFT